MKIILTEDGKLIARLFGLILLAVATICFCFGVCIVDGSMKSGLILVAISGGAALLGQALTNIKL